MRPLKTYAPRNRRQLRHAAVEVGFIVFLFYANLLMGEFTRSAGPRKTLGFAFHDIFTATNAVIALVSALVGYLVFEYLRHATNEP